MTAQLSPIDKAKFVAAKRAVDYVEDGMRIGLGTGSTAAWMVRCLGELVRDEGIKVTGVATSTRTADLARQVGVPISTLDEVKWLDLTIDGADEYDPQLNLIKGGGGALLQEKIVATASDQMIVIADATKQVETLGAFPLPIEVQLRVVFSLVLNQVPGVVENGLFLDICDVVVIGKGDGSVEVRDINNGTVEHERIDIIDTDNLFVDIAE